MEGIVTKALSSYFKKFIKDFRKEQFNLSVLKGTAQLNNLDLHESFIQELLIIPTTLEVISAKCNQLNVNVPNIRKINKFPVVLTIDKLDLSLLEPEVVKPMPISDVEISKNGKRKIPHQIIRDMKIVVGKAMVQIKLLPKKNENFSPELTLEINNIVIQTTDHQFRVVELSDARIKSGNIERSYKQLFCNSISLDLVTTSNANSISIIPILKNIPLEVKVALVLDTNTNQYLSASLDTIIDKVHFEFDEITWQILVKNVFSLKNALRRDIPPTTQHYTVVHSFLRKNQSMLIPPIPIVYDIDTSYRLTVGKWTLKFQKHNNCEEGFLFYGNDYQFFVSPKSKVKPVGDPKKKGKKQPEIRPGDPNELEDDVENLYESTVKIKLASFTFTTLKPRDSPYQNIIQQIIPQNINVNNNSSNNNLSPSLRNQSSNSSPKIISKSSSNSRNSSNNINNSNSNNNIDRDENDKSFIFIHVNHKWRSLTEPLSTFIDISVFGLQIVLDRFAWSDLYNFLIANIQYIPSEEMPNIEITEEEEAKQVMQIIEKLKKVNISDYFKWYSKSQAKIDIKNTQFIFPKDPNSLILKKNIGSQLSPADSVIEKSLIISARSITIQNKPKDWMYVPYLFASLTSLPSSQYLPLCRIGDGHKFQMELSGMEIETFDPDLPNSKVDILRPTSFQVYGRFTEKDENGRRLELAFYASSWVFTISDDQQTYLTSLVLAYQAAFNKLRNKDNLQMNEKKEEEKSFIDFDKHKKVAITTANQLINDSQLDYAKSFTLFESLLQSLKCAISFQAERGCVTFPVVFEDNSVNNINNGNENAGDIEITRKSNVILNFDRLNLIIENSSSSQIVSMSVKAIRAEGFNHPLSPASLSLIPMSSNGFNNIRIYCHRTKPSNLPPSTAIEFSLHGMQVISRIKKGGVKSISNSLSLLVPQLKLLITKITSYFFSNLMESSNNPKNAIIDSSVDEQNGNHINSAEDSKQNGDHNDQNPQNTKIDETIDTLAHTISERAHYLEETLEGIQISWEIIVSDCSLQVFDSQWDETLKEHFSSNNPFGAIYVTSSVTKSFPARSEFLQSELTLTENKAVLSQKQIELQEKERKELTTKLSELKSEVQRELEKLTKELKYLESELATSQSNLSHVQEENNQLRKAISPPSPSPSTPNINDPLLNPLPSRN